MPVIPDRGWNLILSTLLLVILVPQSQSVQLRRVRSCSHQTLTLKCQVKEKIAVHRALFTTENATCGGLTLTTNHCQEDLRVSINNRCRGHNVCSFNFSHDHWDRECHTGMEEEGAIVADYDCVPESSVQRFCNAQVRSLEGYLASPGYPGFFPKLPNCTWNITAGSGQTLLLSVLDLDLPLPRRQHGRFICDDVLHLADGTDSKLLSVCGKQPPETVESTGERVTVYFQSQNFTPFRGFLLYYRVHGCPTLPSPKLGYMVYRNGSSALYMCCEGHVFNDTLDNYRPLHCVDNFHWNATIPQSCVSIEELRENGNYSGYLMDFDMDNTTALQNQPHIYRIETNYLADIVIPSILMAGLIIGNAIVFLVIIKIRRSQKYMEEPGEAKPSSSRDVVPFTAVGLDTDAVLPIAS